MLYTCLTSLLVCNHLSFSHCSVDVLKFNYKRKNIGFLASLRKDLFLLYLVL
jgi:hypothetical protein